MQIHIHRDGQDFGPYTIDQVNQYLLDGTIVPTDMAWADGFPDWTPLPKVPGVVIPAGAAGAGTAAGGGKKTVMMISIAAVAAAAITGGIVFVAMNKGGGGNKAAQAQTEGGSGSGSGAASSGSGDGGMDGGMDGEMGMDGGDMAMGMDMGMAGGGDPSQVMAILEAKCFRCHGNGKSKGGFSMDTRDSGLDAIKPGNPDGSLLLKLVRRDDPDDAMPPKESEALSKAEVAAVAAWIKAGANWK